MGKVRIIENLGDGLYRVQRQYNDTRFQERKAKLEADIERLNDEIEAFFVAVSELESLEEQDRDAYFSAVDSYASILKSGGNVNAARAAMEDAYSDLLERQQALMITRAEQAKAKAARHTARTDLETITEWEDPEPEQAWCADFTDDATGDLASIEVPGEPQHPLIVYPQARDEGTHDPDKHGELMPRQWMTGPQAYFNAAILPGWQRHKPTWRVATIDSIDGDTATVTLDIEESTAQGLPVNEPFIIEGVPIEYMDCNAGAFEEGDRVIVELMGHEWSDARIIGFESNPNPCGIAYVMLSLGGYDADIISLMAKIKLSTGEILDEWEASIPAGYGRQRGSVSRDGKPAVEVYDLSNERHGGLLFADGTLSFTSSPATGLSKNSLDFVGVSMATGSAERDIVTLDKQSLTVETSRQVINPDCEYAFTSGGDTKHIVFAGYDGCSSRGYFVQSILREGFSVKAEVSFGTAEVVDNIAVSRDYVAVLRWQDGNDNYWLSLHAMQDLSLIAQVSVSPFSQGIAVSGDRVIVQREYWPLGSGADGSASIFLLETTDAGAAVLTEERTINPFAASAAAYYVDDRTTGEATT